MLSYYILSLELIGVRIHDMKISFLKKEKVKKNLIIKRNVLILIILTIYLVLLKIVLNTFPAIESFLQKHDLDFAFFIIFGLIIPGFMITYALNTFHKKYIGVEERILLKRFSIIHPNAAQYWKITREKIVNSDKHTVYQVSLELKRCM